MGKKKTCSIILEDSTDKNSKQYSLIYNDKYISESPNFKHHDVILYKRYNGKTVAYPEDIDYILKNYFSPPKMCLII
jgi:hypothetical protein